MIYQKLHVFITLLGAMTTAVTSYLRGDDYLTFSLKLVAAVVIFYIFGSIIRAYLRSKFDVKEPDADADTESGGESGEDKELE
jgi:uncharacterized membrane protein